MNMLSMMLLAAETEHGGSNEIDIGPSDGEDENEDVLDTSHFQGMPNVQSMEAVDEHEGEPAQHQLGSTLPCYHLGPRWELFTSSNYAQPISTEVQN